ncbi:hypothetical protein FA13DRAFT_679641 [Coprinellus micaceus]|uniref:Uncharacterized protein n=1 Tax=Coprinellus micaceus TaxID=71717 RepID=A0A4Y7SBI3_COPMI|nr:hypothetical protein FA13DRAFT_679641 [Coprinellus micaceus]
MLSHSQCFECTIGEAEWGAASRRGGAEGLWLIEMGGKIGRSHTLEGKGMIDAHRPPRSPRTTPRTLLRPTPGNRLPRSRSPNPLKLEGFPPIQKHEVAVFAIDNRWPLSSLERHVDGRGSAGARGHARAGDRGWEPLASRGLSILGWSLRRGISKEGRGGARRDTRSMAK